MSETRVCTKCGLPAQPIENFPWKSRLRGKRHAVCKTCTAKRSGDWYENNKERQIEYVRNNNRNYRENARQFIFEYLSTHPCVDCGETDPTVLEFDHVKGEKNSEVSRLIGRGASIDAIKNELSLCVVRCANCHRRKTAKEQGWFSFR